MARLAGDLPKPSVVQVRTVVLLGTARKGAVMMVDLSKIWSPCFTRAATASPWVGMVLFAARRLRLEVRTVWFSIASVLFLVGMFWFEVGTFWFSIATLQFEARTILFEMRTVLQKIATVRFGVGTVWVETAIALSEVRKLLLKTGTF